MRALKKDEELKNVKEEKKERKKWRREKEKEKVYRETLSESRALARVQK